MKRSRFSGAVLAVAALVAAMAASAAYGISTAFTGEADFVNCTSSSAADGCFGFGTVQNTMQGVSAIALSDDESRVFAASDNDAVTIFLRDRSSGKLTQMIANKGPCVSEGSAIAGCLPGHGLVNPTDAVAVGSNAYIVTNGSNSIVTLTKDNQSGRWQELTNTSDFKYCLSEPAGDGCDLARELSGASAVTAFGPFVYVGSPGSIAAFVRGTKGSLKQLGGTAGCYNAGGSNGCTPLTTPLGTVQSMSISRDGGTLYVADGTNVQVFQRAKGTGALTAVQCLGTGGGCSPLTNVSGPVAVWADKAGTPTSAYVVGSGNTVGVFAKAKATGVLTPRVASATVQSCLSPAGGGAAACTASPALGKIGTIFDLQVYKNNRFVYVGGSAGVASYTRNKATFNLTEVGGAGSGSACTTEGGANGCLPGQGLTGLTDMFSTATKHVYVASSTFDAVTWLHQR